MSGNITDLLDSRLKAIFDQVEQLPDSGTVGSRIISEEFKAACKKLAKAIVRKEDLDYKFSAYLQKSAQILSQLDDPEWGPIGRALLDAAADCHVQERIRPCVYQSDYDDTKEPYTPTFSSFGFDKDEYGFANVINNDPVNTTFARLFRGKVHEIVHAAAMGKSPALHASPWNPATNVILCPRDFVRVMLLSERDAYAKEAWLCHLAQRFCPDLELTADNAPVTPRWFTDMREMGAALPNLLQKAALRSLDIRHKSELGIITTYTDHYINWALKTYKQALDIRDKLKLPFPICARLDDDDLISVGNSYGPNIFEDKNGQLIEAYGCIPNFSKEQQVLLNELNARLGIDFSEERLRTLETCLASNGVSKAEYLQNSLNQGVRRIVDRPAPKLGVISGGLDSGPA